MAIGSWWQQWRKLRARQLARIDDRIPHQIPHQEEHATKAPAPDEQPPVSEGDEHTAEEHEHVRRHQAGDPAPAGAFGPIGRPLSRTSPFLFGLTGGLGVLLAYSLWRALGSLSTVLTLIVVSLFLTLALNPIVERLIERGLARRWAVTAVSAMVAAAGALLALIVVPPVIRESSEIARNAPQILEDLVADPGLRDFNETYHVFDRINQELTRRLQDADFMSSLVDGVLGAGRVIATGMFSAITVLVLTLYFLASLPALKRAAYACVPASRRMRVQSLSEEIMRRVGAYAIGQLIVATTNALCAYVMMKILDIPYAAVLAVAVGTLGLIPMVGATLGAVIVALVALSQGVLAAVIVLGYFVVYQQIENYLIAPRVMQRTVSVPGGVTIVAALVGASLAGVLGALLAIPTAAGLLLIYDEVLVPRQQRA
ncbi:MAG: AI-2E family transporter [Actinomycetales bacterium]|nr:MAG: AI-2E family transporter [Actinomycetales bacterium]